VQISGLSIALPQSPNQQRPESAARALRIQEQQPRSSEQGSGDTLAANRERQEQQRPVFASSEADRIDLRRISEAQTQQSRQNSQNLSLNTQRALQAFQQNSPSIEEQLGVELAGIDTFA
jgi:hypothetical protein